MVDWPDSVSAANAPGGARSGMASGSSIRTATKRPIIGPPTSDATGHASNNMTVNDMRAPATNACLGFSQMVNKK